MENYVLFEVLLIILGIIWSILGIILFFKVWGMTNDIKKIKNYLLHSQALKKKISSPVPQEVVLSKERNIKRGDVVINLRNGKEIIADEINEDGSFVCYIDNKYTGIFQSNEIATKEEYSNNKK